MLPSGRSEISENVAVHARTRLAKMKKLRPIYIHLFRRGSNMSPDRLNGAKWFGVARFNLRHEWVGLPTNI